VARLGNGSMRDALSLLDRLLATGAPALNPRLLEEMLGLPAQDRVAALVGALAQGDAAAALGHAAGLLESGTSQDQLLEVLIDRLRQLLIVSACGPDSDLVELADDDRAAAAAQARNFDAPGLVHMIALCENLQRNTRASAHPRALLDATVVRLALAEKMADVTALLQQDPRTPAAAPVDQKKKTLDPEKTGAPSAVLMSRDRQGADPPPATPLRVESEPLPHGRGSSEDASPAHPQPPAPAPTEPAAIWSALLEHTADKPSASWVRGLEMRSFDGRRAVVTPLPGQRDLGKFLNAQRCEQLAAMIGQVIRKPVKVEVDTDAAGAAPPAGPGSGAAAEPDARGPAAGPVMDRQQALALPLVRQVLELFDATLIDVAPEQAQAPAPTPPAAAAPRLPAPRRDETPGEAPESDEIEP